MLISQSGWIIRVPFFCALVATESAPLGPLCLFSPLDTFTRGTSGPVRSLFENPNPKTMELSSFVRWFKLACADSWLPPIRD